MDYQQSRAYIRDAEQYAGGAMDLTNIKELMKRLGNPRISLNIFMWQEPTARDP